MTRRLLLTVLLGAICASRASADWLITPWIGLTFGGNTSLVDLEGAAGNTTLTYGGSAGRLGSGILGFDVDFGYSPGFFERDEAPRLVSQSSVATLMGNVIVAAPLRWTGFSLRPYASGGAGLMRASIEDVLGVFTIDRSLFGVNVGGGAIGFITNRTGIRWDVRYLRSVKGQDESNSFGTTRLSFWRANIGVVLGY